MANNRIKGNRETKVFRPEVRIISSTTNPVGTIFALWYGSRHSDTLDPNVVQYLYDVNKPYEDLDDSLINLKALAKKICDEYPEHAGDGTDYKNVISEIVKLVIKLDLPPVESVNFTIEVSNANVAWREQLVRSKFATYWTQTSRTQDMTSMDVNRLESVELLGGQKAVEIYDDAVEYLRKAYEQLAALGVPMEDIRLQPQGHIHRVYWMINLRALLKILNKRADWIAQGSLWTPVNAGVIKELGYLGLRDIISDFIGKPAATVSNGVVDTHKQDIENQDRFYGRDPLPVDPLWLAYSGNKMPANTNIEFYDYLKSMFIQIWSDEYLDVLGWDRNDPSKLGKYDRP